MIKIVAGLKRKQMKPLPNNQSKVKKDVNDFFCVQFLIQMKIKYNLAYIVNILIRPIISV